MHEILVPISVFAMVVAIVYLNIRKKERMALLQYNKDASVFRSTKNTNPSLKYGLLLIFLGGGLLVANYMDEAGIMSEEPAYFSMLSLSAGLSLLIYYFIEKSRPKEEEKTEDKEL